MNCQYPNPSVVFCHGWDRLKWHPIVDLDSGIYLRISKVRAFTLVSTHFYLFPCPSQHYLHRSQLLSPVGRPLLVMRQLRTDRCLDYYWPNKGILWDLSPHTSPCVFPGLSLFLVCSPPPLWATKRSSFPSSPCMCNQPPNCHFCLISVNWWVQDVSVRVVSTSPYQLYLATCS